MFKVLKLNKGTATVSTRGLYRVVVRPTGQVVGELEPRYLAKTIADTFNACNDKRSRAVVIPYARLGRQQ